MSSTNKKEQNNESYGPFDFVKSIQITNKNLIKESDNPELVVKQYNAYIVNKALAFQMDSILFANDMNINNHLDGELQYDYFLCAVRKMKRGHAWFKKKNDESIDLIKQFYNVNHTRAQEIASILDKDQISEIKTIMTKGERKK